jgi:hypothetical protein
MCCGVEPNEPKKKDKDAAREERLYTYPQKRREIKMQHGKSVCIPTPSFSVSSDLLLLNTTQQAEGYTSADGDGRGAAGGCR